MSLFGGVFSFNGDGGLFAKSSQFKQGQQQQQQQQQEQEQADGSEQRPRGEAAQQKHQQIIKGFNGKNKRKQPSADADLASAAAPAAAAAAKAQPAGTKHSKKHTEKPGKQHDAQRSQNQFEQQQQLQLQKDKQQQPISKQDSKPSKRAKKQTDIAGAVDGGKTSAKAAEAADAGGVADASVQPQSKKAKHSHKQDAKQTQDGGAGSLPQQADKGSGSDTEPAAAVAAPAQEPVDPEAAAKAAAEKLSRTIFVGNLPVTIKSKQVKQLFARFGPVESVRLRSVPLDMDVKKKLPRKAAVIRGLVTAERGGTKAYVVFEREDSVGPALSMNMTVVSGAACRHSALQTVRSIACCCTVIQKVAVEACGSFSVWTCV
jgi:nucleolar protein 12